MEFQHARRLTVDGDAHMYPCVVAYVDRRLQTCHPIWWDLRYLHQWYKAVGEKYDFKAFCKKLCPAVMSNNLLSAEVCFKTEWTAGNVLAHICTTRWLFQFLWRRVSLHGSNLRSIAPDRCMQCLLSACSRALLTAPAQLRTFNIDLPGESGQTFQRIVAPNDFGLHSACVANY